MLKLCLACLIPVFFLLSCGAKDVKNENAVLEKAVDSYGALIEKAKGTEALLQKKVDSIIDRSDSLGIPR